MKELKFGYCIIKKAFTENGKIMIFVNAHDSPTLNTEIISSDDYKEVCKLLKELGFLQIDMFIFENILDVDLKITDLKQALKKQGLKYNKNLEASILKELSDSNIQTSPEDFLAKITNKIKAKIPKVGEVVEFYFYLFLESDLLKSGEILFLFNGDFYSKKSEINKKFVKIISSKFRRVVSPNQNELVFESVSRYKDFISEIDCLYTVNVDIPNPFQSKNGKVTYQQKYSIMEVKDVINLENYIVISLENKLHYAKLKEYSDRIKNEFINSPQNNVPVEYLKSRIEKSISFFEKRINIAVEKEEYELAQSYKQTIESLSSKLDEFKNYKKDKISGVEYDEIMSIGNVMPGIGGKE